MGLTEYEKPKALNGNQIKLLKKSFRSIDTDKLATRFYGYLFEKFPDIKPLFNSDLSEQTAKLVSVFELIIFSFEERKADQYFLQKSIIIPLRTLGKTHSDKGVLNAHYPMANEILIKSLKDEMGLDFTTELEEAWTLALKHLTVAMLSNEFAYEEQQTGSIKEAYKYIKSILFKT